MNIRKLIVQFLAVLNTAEGIIHLIVASVGMWGCIDLGVYDFRVLLPNIENFVFGIFSVLTGVIMARMVEKGPKIKIQAIKKDKVEYQKPEFIYINPDIRKLVFFPDDAEPTDDWRTCRQCS